MAELGPQQPPAKKHGGALVGWIIVIVIVIIVALALPYLIPKKGTIVVNVNSSHILYSINYRIFIDGTLKDTGSLSAGYYVKYTYSMLFWDSCHNYNVYGDSTGGGLGATSDSKSITLCNGETRQVDLTL
jgi:hypothetical protein